MQKEAIIFLLVLIGLILLLFVIGCVRAYAKEANATKAETAGAVGFSIGRFLRTLAIILFFPVALVIIACIKLACGGGKQ